MRCTSRYGQIMPRGGGGGGRILTRQVMPCRCALSSQSASLASRWAQLRAVAAHWVGVPYIHVFAADLTTLSAARFSLLTQHCTLPTTGTKAVRLEVRPVLNAPRTA